MSDHERTAALMVPSKLAEMVPVKKATPWFDQPAAHVGEVQIDHLAATLDALRVSHRSDSTGALEDALRNWQKQHDELRFDGLQIRGWWGRATGKSKSAGAEFAEQVARLVALQTHVDAQGSQFQDEIASRAAADEHVLIDAELDLRALDDLVEKGAKWLQDMQAELKKRHAAALDDAGRQGVRRDAARCEALVPRLKALRALGASTRKVILLLREAHALRQSQVQLLSRDLHAAARAWRGRLVSLAAAVEDGTNGPELSLEGPQEMHSQLGKQLQKANDGLSQLRAVEAQWESALPLMADSLAVLREPGRAAA
jgi:hypothetical protein